MTDQPILHVTFGWNADVTLRGALRRARRREPVVRLWDDLGFGPIDPTELAARWVWAKRELGLFARDRRLFLDKNNDWNAALAPATRRIAWVSRRMAHEYCGFLEWLWRIGDAPCEVVDLHDVEFNWHLLDGTVRRSRVDCLGWIHPHHVSDNAFWDLARPLTRGARRGYRDLWRRLKSESTPFRVLRDQNLISAPITRYDELILAEISCDFRKVARVVGSAPWYDAPAVLHYVLQGRVHWLVQDGVLEGVGDLARMRFSEVRWARKAKAPVSGGGLGRGKDGVHRMRLANACLMRVSRPQQPATGYHD